MILKIQQGRSSVTQQGYMLLGSYNPAGSREGYCLGSAGSREGYILFGFAGSREDESLCVFKDRNHPPVARKRVTFYPCHMYDYVQGIFVFN